MMQGFGMLGALPEDILVDRFGLFELFGPMTSDTALQLLLDRISGPHGHRVPGSNAASPALLG